MAIMKLGGAKKKSVRIGKSHCSAGYRPRSRLLPPNEEFNFYTFLPFPIFLSFLPKIKVEIYFKFIKDFVKTYRDRWKLTGIDLSFKNFTYFVKFMSA